MSSAPIRNVSSARAEFDARHGLEMDETGTRVKFWNDSSVGNVGESWRLYSVETHSPLYEPAPPASDEGEGIPHLRFLGNEWMVLENSDSNHFELLADEVGSTISVVVQNGRTGEGFHEIFGGAGRGPNAQIRFESPDRVSIMH